MRCSWMLLHAVIQPIYMQREASGRTCGVEMMTEPDSRSRWLMLSCASPVPGGMSMTRTSSGAHDTFVRKVLRALITCRGRMRQRPSRCQCWCQCQKHAVTTGVLHCEQLHAGHACNISRNCALRRLLPCCDEQAPHHWTPPHSCHVLVHEEPHGHALHAIVHQGNHSILCSHTSKRPSLHTAWTINVMAIRLGTLVRCATGNTDYHGMCDAEQGATGWDSRSSQLH